jgi:aldehyde dehydrogenase (NAD+)
MRPDEVVGSSAASERDDVAAAIAAARRAFTDWSRTPAPQRGDVLMRVAARIDERAEDIAVGMTCEMGKPLREARGEVARAAAILRFFAGEGTRPTGEVYEQTLTRGQIMTLRRPVGVVGLIAPWNFPVAIPTWKMAPALVYGNTIVLKLAWDASLTGLRLADCFADAGLPPGVVNVVTGSGATVGDALVADPEVDAISFTGSVPVGRSIRRTATELGKRAQLELGGHNPLIVLADARLEAAVEAAYAGAFWSAGQKCTATRRIYIEASAYDEFRERFLGRVASGKVGDPLDPATEVGPLAGERQFTDVLAAIERGRTEGGTVVAGGEPAAGAGLVIEPTVFEGVRDDAYLTCNEVFGPVTSLYSVADVDEAIERSNAVEFGLSASIFTQSHAAVQQFARDMQAGILHVNSQTAGAEVHVPFGGLKASGWGPHEQGRAAREFYTDEITLYLD